MPTLGANPELVVTGIQPANAQEWMPRTQRAHTGKTDVSAFEVAHQRYRLAQRPKDRFPQKQRTNFKAKAHLSPLLTGSDRPTRG
jgi:hypothetical protein